MKKARKIISLFIGISFLCGQFVHPLSHGMGKYPYFLATNSKFNDPIKPSYAFEIPTFSSENSDLLYFFMLLKSSIEDKTNYSTFVAIRDVLKNMIKENSKRMFGLLKIALNDDNGNVRRIAAAGLGHVYNAGIKEALPLIKMALKDKNDNVRHGAMEGLQHIAESGKENVVTLIEEGLNEGNLHVRFAAAIALEKAVIANMTEAWALLKNSLKHKDSKVCNAVAYTLGNIIVSKPQALSLLKEVLDNGTKEEKSYALRNLGFAIFSGREEISTLVENKLSDDDETIRFEAASCFGYAAALGDQKAFSFFEKTINKKDDDNKDRAKLWGVKKGFLLGLEKADTDFKKKIFPNFENYFNTDHEDAVIGLGHFAASGIKETLPLLEKAFTSDNERVRREAAVGIGKAVAAGIKEAFPLYEKAIQDKDIKVRQGVALGLSHISTHGLKSTMQLIQIVSKYEPFSLWKEAPNRLKRFLSNSEKGAKSNFISDMQKEVPFLKDSPNTILFSIAHFISASGKNNLM